MSVVPVIINKMSLWSVVINIVNKCAIMTVFLQSSPLLIPVVHILHLILVDLMTQVICFQTYIIDYMYIYSILMFD